jgi:hypothetical protein
VAVAARSLQTALGNLLAQRRYTQSRTYADEASRDAATARIDGRIASTQAQIENLERRIRGADVCPICYDESMDNRTVAPCCGNSYCLACITRWLARNGSCPMCKAPVDPGGLMVILPDACGPEPEAPGPAAPADDPNSLLPFRADASLGKVENLRSLMRHFAADTEAGAGPRRVLVFSDNDEIMRRVSTEVMSAEGIPHSFLKSNAAVINAKAREFRQTRGLYALLTNIRYYGSGLDLSAATDIVLMHKVQDGMAAQVVGRAQRPPRTDPLRIWKFRNDIEDAY